MFKPFGYFMDHAQRYNDWDDTSDDWSRSGDIRADTGSHNSVQDWNSLQDELENLLDQVHLHAQNLEPAYEQHPMAYKEVRQNAPFRSAQQFHPSPDRHTQDRHTQALASVQRAMDRFTEPQEAPLMPAQSQHQLQNAIRQIRSSQRGQDPRAQQYAPRPPFQNTPSQAQAPYREPGFQQPTQRRAPRQRINNSRDFSPRQPQNGAQFEAFGSALEEISSRLEQFEHKFIGQQNSDAAVADMATQLEQLSGVVEHLANNIGERGQIKRLENQIAKMADAIPTGADLDFKSLNKRLDVLSSAFEKLRDLQAQQVELNIKSNEGGGYMDSIETGVRNIYERLDDLGQEKVDLKPIESSVRSVYDRIDALEQTMAMPTPAIERLSREMAEFTRSMRDEDTANLSADLIAQVGGLVSRIEQIETEGTPVGDLKLDMAQLQTSVEQVMEPRFAALENKIGGLSGKLDKTAKAGQDNTKAPIVALEKHLKALAQKLDKTSNDLNGLQEVFAQTKNNSDAPNINAIADIVAQRTSQAMEQMQAKSSSGIEQGALDQLESRLSNLFANQKQPEPAPQPVKEFGQVQNSINQVNQRLARLEETLSLQAEQTAQTKAAVAAVQVTQKAAQKDPTPPAPAQQTSPQNAPTHTGRTRGQAQRGRHPGLTETSVDRAENIENREPAEHLIPALRDNMPRPPAQDGPLRASIGNNSARQSVPQDTVPQDTVTQEQRIPIPASLKVDPSDLQVMESEVHELDEPSPIKPTPGRQSSSAPQNTGRIKLPQFNDENVTPPPAPASDFAQATPKKPQPATPTPAAKTSPKPNADVSKTPNTPAPSTSNKISRSTFIEAARRAAQSGNAEVEEAGSQSIIARAMSRFQKKQADAKLKKSDQGEENRQFPGDETVNKFGSAESRISSKMQETPSPEDELDDLTTVPESFLTRHRQPILLAATVVAVGFLTLNLINQRFSSADPAPASSVSEMSTALTPEIMSEEPAAPPSGSPANMGTMNNGAADAKFQGDKATKPTEQNSPISNDVVGSIDQMQLPAGSPVRQINPVGNTPMPTALDEPARVETASLSLGDVDMSSAGLEMPPEAVGPELLRKTAADGDPRAQFEIAAIYAEGRALPQDLAAAAVWYERAAAQGFAPASYRLANMLENGVGVEKNLSGARLWYQLAADAGNRMSMHNLASLLAGGQLGEPQFDSAAHWFEQAASLGLKDSQFNLGMLYARGLGVTQSLENSYKWFSIAAKSGDEDAAKARDDIARSLDAQVVARLQNDVMAWAPADMNIRANFAPIGTWSTDFDPGPEIDAREVIRKVQTALNNIGFDTGTPDGLIGPKTIEAITGFETQTGMSPSGKVNPRLLAVLGSQPV